MHGGWQQLDPTARKATQIEIAEGNPDLTSNCPGNYG
jgi:hypothetical protein